MSHVDLILTTFSPAMFGTGATVHIKPITLEDAQKLVDEDTKIWATRISHDRLARLQFPAAHEGTPRYAQPKPGTMAIHMHYRGPQVPDSREVTARWHGLILPDRGRGVSGSGSGLVLVTARPRVRARRR